jgi:hypothetical protein
LPYPLFCKDNIFQSSALGQMAAAAVARTKSVAGQWSTPRWGWLWQVGSTDSGGDGESGRAGGPDSTAAGIGVASRGYSGSKKN